MYTNITTNNNTTKIACLKQQIQAFEYFSSIQISRNHLGVFGLFLNEFFKIDFLKNDCVVKNDFSNLFHFVYETYLNSDAASAYRTVSQKKGKVCAIIFNHFFDSLQKLSCQFNLRKPAILFQNKYNEEPSKKTRCLKSCKNYRFIDAENRLHLKTTYRTTNAFYMQNDSETSAHKTVRFFESILTNNVIRINNNHNINSENVIQDHLKKPKCLIKNKESLIRFLKYNKRSLSFHKINFIKHSN